MRERRDAIARLATQRDAALRHAGEVEARLGRLTSQVSSLRDSFSVMTSPAVEVCNLRAATPEQADARGMLFVAADHQHWAMSLRGLRPPAGGKVYQLWLIGRAPNKIRSEGLLATSHNGHTGPVLISGVLAGDTLGVSVQQAGGSIQPTLKAVIVLIPAS